MSRPPRSHPARRANHWESASRRRPDRAFPSGVLGPVERPPCSRHRPFLGASLVSSQTARAWHGVPLRVFAPQRGRSLRGVSLGTPSKKSPIALARRNRSHSGPSATRPPASHCRRTRESQAGPSSFIARAVERGLVNLETQSSKASRSSLFIRFTKRPPATAASSVHTLGTAPANARRLPSACNRGRSSRLGSCYPMTRARVGGPGVGARPPAVLRWDRSHQKAIRLTGPRPATAS
jgi:hypothetical protein